MGLKKIFTFIISVISTLYTFYIIVKLMVFLMPVQNTSFIKNWTWAYNLMDSQSKISTALPAIINNVLHITAFILQHSLMKSALVKNMIRRLGLEHLGRIIYNLTTSICLQNLINKWKPVQSIIIWNIDISKNQALWWAFLSIHIIGWIIIYGGSIIMDLPELLGLKQIYYYLKKNCKPMEYKSFGLQTILSHVQHPSIIALSVILCATNIMTIDRLVLAIMLIVYMFVAWSTTEKDLSYQRMQLERKKQLYY